MAISSSTISSPDGSDAPEAELVAWLARCLGRGDLAALPCDDLHELARHLREDRYSRGSMIYARDDLPARVHILRRDSVELTRRVGGRDAVIQRLGPGAVFGDVPLFLRTGEPTEAVATDDAVVMSIDSLILFGLLGRRPALARRWLVSVAERMAAMQNRVGDLLAGSLDRQVASWLLREDGGDGVTISQQTLARLLGARRTSVNQSLRRLEAGGYIETGYRRIRLVDREGLDALLATR